MVEHDGSWQASSAHLARNLFRDNPDEVARHRDPFDACFAACEVVAAALHVSMTRPSLDLTAQPAMAFYLQRVAEHNLLRLREVRLPEDWWKQDYGPLMVCYGTAWCAAIPGRQGEYILHDFSTGQRQKLSAQTAGQIDRQAFLFCRTFQNETPGARGLLRFAFTGLGGDVLKMLSYQAIASLLLLLSPLLTATIFEEVIPYASIPLLIQYAGVLGVACVSVMLLQLLQMLLVLRMQIRMQYTVEVAVWDRLLRLPMAFFRHFSVGDLAFRASIPSLMVEYLCTNLTAGLVGGFSALTSVGLMFFINAKLALALFVTLLLLLTFTLVITRFILCGERVIARLRSSLFGTVLGLLNAIVKLRVAHREAEAFALWQQEVSAKFAQANQVNRQRATLEIFDAGFTGFGMLVLFTLVMWFGEAISFGEFIVINSAFVASVAALQAFLAALSACLEIIPLFALAGPLFEARPEDESGRQRNLSLRGEIGLHNVVFRYPESDKPLFVGLNLSIEPGSFTAIVGPSGSGKSTILRLLLGLETPESGEITWDGIRQSHLDMHWLRTQIGTVLQTTRPFPGSIFENMAAKNPQLTRELAWEIAERVGFAAFVRDLPMGMDTLVHDGVQTFSGGELQRLNIACAMSTNPRIVLFDEATSALDNEAGLRIQECLAAMQVTRVVVAHRLSSIRMADIIHVIEAGKCVESGRFDALIEQRGAFWTLVQKGL